MSERAALRAVVVRGVIFASPLVAVLGSSTWLLDRFGELDCVDLPRVVKAQRAEPSREVLYGPAYSDCTAYLKMLGIEAERPDVLVLGTSRSVQVRSEFFRARAFNAGGAVARTGELKTMLDKLPRDRQPTTIFVMLDQFLLNGATDEAAGPEFGPFDDRLSRCTSTKDFLAEAWPRPLRDLAARKIPASSIWRPAYPDALGIRGQLQGAGYRRDGSYSIGTHGATSFDEVRGRMRRGVRRYEYGDDVSPAMVTALSNFLDAADARGIFVAALLPPYAPTILDEMNVIGRWKYVSKVYPTIRPLFEKHGFVVRDFSDPRPFGLHDKDFYDGFHGSERVVATLFLEMARESAKMRDVIATERIEQMLAASGENWSIVPEGGLISSRSP